jgi:hypothetical protein
VARSSSTIVHPIVATEQHHHHAFPIVAAASSPTAMVSWSTNEDGDSLLDVRNTISES